VACGKCCDKEAATEGEACAFSNASCFTLASSNACFFSCCFCKKKTAPSATKTTLMITPLITNNGERSARAIVFLKFFNAQAAVSCYCEPNTRNSERRRLFGGDFGLWLSLVERLVRDEEAVGSNPTSPTEPRSVRGIRKRSSLAGSLVMGYHPYHH
jgi:hypothetical protein